MTRAKDISKIVTDADLSGTLDVTGTVTAGGLTVNDTIRLDNEDTTISTGDVFGDIEFYDNDGGSASAGVTAKVEAKAVNTYGSSDLNFYTSNSSGGARTAQKVAMTIGGGNDISFYEDTGTTPKLFWDASDERLGIGTSSPERALHVEGAGIIKNTSGEALFKLTAANTSNSILEFADTDDGNVGRVQYEHDNNAMLLYTNDTERMRIDSGGNVIIGETNAQLLVGLSSSGEQVHIKKSTNTGLRLETTNTNGIANFDLQNDARIYRMRINGSNSDAWELFDGTASSTRLVVDSSGNLLVGKTSTSFDTTGSGILSGGEGQFVRDGGHPISVNRKTSDGNLIYFAKDGTTVGSIECGSVNRLIINGDSNGLAFERAGTEELRIGNNVVNPSDDNDCDLGLSYRRFDDVYATNGTIQTSDRNEKQDIEELSDAEQRVAVVAKGLMRKFRWIDSVAEKGDNARTHFGIIAQDLQDAFTAEGLDAGDYALFTSNTWWEHDGEVYDTEEEAPEGATQKTRLGVRYSELLAFIISAI